MNWKLTVALVLIAAAVGVFAYINPFASPEERKDKSPWFYQVSFDDIIHIEVSAGENTERFFKNDQDAWVFERFEGIPASHSRWGGIVLLLSGPQTRRDFSTVRETIDDPAEYGLDDPVLVVKIGLTADRSLEFRLGDVTTDGNHHYGQVIGFPQLFLIANLWGEVLARLANEPPLPKWWEYRDPEVITEVNIYLGELGEPEGPLLRLQQEDGEWFIRDLNTDEENRPVDPDKFAEYIPLLGGPNDFKVDQYRVRDRDYIDWGIDQTGHSIEIRFAGTTERGTRFIDGVLFLIGNKTEDGKRYYAIPASDLASTPLIQIDAEWADTLFEMVDNVPYGESDAASSG